MNIIDARELLSSLWCLYPNASSLSKDLAKRMAFEWAAFFADFSLNDVRKGMMEAVKSSPKYIPNAPEIYLHCVRTLDCEISHEEYTWLKIRGCVEEVTAYEAAEKEYICRERDRWEPELRAVLNGLHFLPTSV